METLLSVWNKYKGPLLYLFFGGLTTLINIVVYAICANQLHMYYQLANFIAWFASVVFAFLTNKVWVFGSHYTTVKNFFGELISFFFYRGLSYFIDAFIMYLGVSVLAQNGTLTKLVDQIVIVVLNYFFSKFLIFKEGNKANQKIAHNEAKSNQKELKK